MAKSVDELLRCMLKDLSPALLLSAAPHLVAAANTLYRHPYKDTTLKRNALALLRSIVLLPGLHGAHPRLFDPTNAVGLHSTAAFRVVWASGWTHTENAQHCVWMGGLKNDTCSCGDWLKTAREKTNWIQSMAVQFQLRQRVGTCVWVVHSVPSCVH